MYWAIPQIMSGANQGLSANETTLGTLIQQYAQNELARKQAAITNKSIEDARRQLVSGQTQAVGTLAPYMQGGQQAMTQYQGLLSEFDPSLYTAQDQGQFQYSMPQYTVDQFLNPGMEYEQQLAQQSVDASAAARGGLRSGATLKELQDRSQAIARTGYGEAFNRMQVAQQGARTDRAQAYQQFADRANMLANQANQRLAAFQTQLGGLQNMTGLGAQTAGNLASMQSDYGQSLANLDLMKGVNTANAKNTGWMGMLGGGLQQHGVLQAASSSGAGDVSNNMFKSYYGGR